VNRRILIALTLLLAVTLAGESQAQKARKLPAGAYLKSAKIGIVSGDTAKYAEAIAMLDSLIIAYGPHAEGLYWLTQIQVDFVEKSSTPQQKSIHIKRIVGYADSLRRMCADPNGESKNKKDCDKWISIVDSLKVKYWGEFYNRGVEQLNAAKDMIKEKEGTVDSVTIAFAEKSITANSDSAIQNLTVAISVDPSDFRSYVAIGNVYDGIGKYEEALDWTKKGFEKASDPTPLLMPLAIYNINLDRYCEAIPYFKGYVEKNPTDVVTMYNLSICYVRCEQLDSAVGVYRQILTVDSTHFDAFSRLGEHFFRHAKIASDSIGAHSNDENNSKMAIWKADRDRAYDSSAHWFSRAFSVKQDDATIAGQYAMVQALAGKFESASVGYKRLCELEPKDANNWIYLGDCYTQMKHFKDAVSAYEKAEAIDDSRIGMLEHMLDIYRELGDVSNTDRMTAKLAKKK
jgi:tetratricopeptide (TPR) repeat protein